MTQTRRGQSGRPIVAGAIFLLCIVGVPLATPLLNGITPPIQGLVPLGYALVAHAVPALFALFILGMRWNDRNDDH